MKMRGLGEESLKKLAEVVQVPSWGGEQTVELSDEDPMVFFYEDYKFWLEESPLEEIDNRIWKIFGSGWSAPLGQVVEFKSERLPRLDGLVAFSSGIEREHPIDTDPRIAAASVLVETL